MLTVPGRKTGRLYSTPVDVIEVDGVRWLVELTVIAGHFGLICGINNAFEVPPSPQGDQLPV